MKDINLLKNAWRMSLGMFVALVMVISGLFLNLTAVSATGTTASPTPTPSASPSSNPTPPTFPNCIDKTTFGDVAHYDSGMHQIVGNGLLEGRDDVYSLSNGNFLQCFIPPTKDVCIQTNWWRTDAVIDGWYSVNGQQWNLGNVHYLAKNINYDCEPEPTPTPSPSPTPTPTPVVSPTPSPCTTCGGQHQEQKQEQHNNQTVNVTVAATPAVAGAKVPVKSPETGVSVLGIGSILGAGPVGLALSRFGKGRITSKKDEEESIEEMAMNLAEKRAKRQAA